MFFKRACSWDRCAEIAGAVWCWLCRYRSWTAGSWVCFWIRSAGWARWSVSVALSTECHSAAGRCTASTRSYCWNGWIAAFCLAMTETSASCSTRSSESADRWCLPRGWTRPVWFELRADFSTSCTQTAKRSANRILHCYSRLSWPVAVVAPASC